MLVAVTGPPANTYLQGCLGAYVTAIAVAHSRDECLAQVAETVRTIGLKMEEVVWCEMLRERLAKYDIEDYLLDLASATEADGRTRFGVFHVWEDEDNDMSAAEANRFVLLQQTSPPAANDKQTPRKCGDNGENEMHIGRPTELPS